MIPGDSSRAGTGQAGHQASGS